MFGWLKRMDRHSKLVIRMADTVGADLGREASVGLGHSDGLRSLMIRCTDCKSADECGEWLDANHQGAASPPKFCRNGKAIMKLRESTGE